MPNKKTEKKVSSKPWMQDQNPWTQNSFRLRKKHEGFTERFVANTPKSVSKHEDYGRVIADCRDYGYETSENHGTQLIRGDQILMEMPNEWAEKRTDYFQKKTQKRTQSSVNQIAKDISETADKLGEEGIAEINIKI